MNLNDKLHAFKNGSLFDNGSEIEFSQLANYGIDIPKNIKCMTEEGVRLKSPYLGNGTLFIGAYSYMNDGGYIRDDVFIGRYCSIGRRVTIGAGMHSMSGLSTSPYLRGSRARAYNEDERNRVKLRTNGSTTIIENDVWIGDGAIICPGVKIKTGAVIGANSVVTRDVECYSIYAGSPAKKIGQRFEDLVISALLDTKWWESSLETLNNNPLSNVYDLIGVFPLEEKSYQTYIFKRL
ncbi:CatB-related O-acetyltransferase [Aeromonas encheleia]